MKKGSSRIATSSSKTTRPTPMPHLFMAPPSLEQRRRQSTGGFALTQAWKTKMAEKGGPAVSAFRGGRPRCREVLSGQVCGRPSLASALPRDVDCYFCPVVGGRFELQPSTQLFDAHAYISQAAAPAGHVATVESCA